MQEGSLQRFDDTELPVLSRVWKLALNTSVKLKKMRVKKRAVSGICALAQKYMIVDDHQYENSTKRLIVHILTAVLRNTEVRTVSPMLIALVSCFYFQFSRFRCRYVTRL